MPRSVTASVALVALMCGLGCRPADEIRTYTVPKEKSRAAVAERPTEPLEPATPTDRMLVAAVPHGDQATFFKVVGSIAKVERVAAEVKTFVESLEVSDDKPPTWKLPDGWSEDTTREMRRATLTMPAGDSTLEIAITQFPWQKNDDFVLANINRWRGQIGLPPIDVAALARSYEELKVGETEGLWLDMTGKSTGASMPPFASGAPRPPVSEPTLPPQGNAAPSKLPYAQKVPESWKEKPATGFRLAGFQVGEGENAPEVTVFSFSTAAPQMASPIANIDRWRGEIGLPPIEESELAKIARQVTISGMEGVFVEMESPTDHKPFEATLAAMTQRGDQIWFFKLRGPRDAALAERERFLEWLHSIQFGKE